MKICGKVANPIRTSKSSDFVLSINDQSIREVTPDSPTSLVRPVS